MDASCAIRFTWLRPIADLLMSASTLDMPQEWLSTLEWILAKELGPSYEVPPAKWDRILMMAPQGSASAAAVKLPGYRRGPLACTPVDRPPLNRLS